ncbi:zf-TFIIB domain-containing protein [Myxococcus sp. RHST-1-4]|nr:zf-TFIIB domain-containing protein [Myxococcus sp. RHSTA-1-4]
MSACPFCRMTMRSTFIGGLSREECGGCGSVWFEGEALVKVMGGSVSDALLRRAKGQPGICKGCHAKLQYVPSCPDCGAHAPTCPRCGHGPLPVVEALGVAVEVCSDCAGVALDPGELRQLQRAAEAYRNEPLDVRPRLRLGVTPGCAACRRNVKPKYGFVWEEKLYCGSCAPEGSVPFSDDLSKAEPSAGYFAQHDSGYTAASGTDATGSALMWLFSRVFGR